MKKKFSENKRSTKMDMLKDNKLIRFITILDF